jgi:hypothetical protein
MQKPQIAVCAPLDAISQRLTQGFVLVGGISTLPALFLALSGLLMYPLAFYGALVCAAVAAGFLTFLVLSWAGMPTQIRIEADALVIERRWHRAVRIGYETIEAVTVLPVAADMRATRFAFNAGVFGYHGPFISERYGRFFAYATDRDKTVAIARRGAPMLVVSPLLPFAFVGALREALTQKKDT